METQGTTISKKKKFHTITLYFNDEEFEWFSNAVAAARMSKAGYVRSKLFSGRAPRAKVSLEKANWYRELQLMNIYLKNNSIAVNDLLAQKIEELVCLNYSILKTLISDSSD
jgi:hypothetical protein